jgi:hypothetical protein
VNSVGSEYGPVAGCCERGDEPSNCGDTEFVGVSPCGKVGTLHRVVN